MAAADFKRIFHPNFSIGEEIGGKTCVVFLAKTSSTQFGGSLAASFLSFFSIRRVNNLRKRRRNKTLSVSSVVGCGGIVKTQILMSLLFEGELGAFFL